MPLIAVNDVELYYQPHGSGAPLVLLGGLGPDASQMGMLTGPLAEGFQVIAAGNRGTGRSAKPAGAALEISYSAPLRRGRTELVRGCSTCAEQPAGDVDRDSSVLSRQGGTRMTGIPSPSAPESVTGSSPTSAASDGAQPARSIACSKISLSGFSEPTSQERANP